MEYNKKESKFVNFILRYFAKDTKKEDKWLSKSITIFLLAAFIIGFIATYFEKENLASGFMVIFSTSLGVLWVILFTAAIIHKYINKKDKEK